jgi:hypothetical protein
VHLLLVEITQNVGILGEISFARVASLISHGETLIKDVTSVLMIGYLDSHQNILCTLGTEQCNRLIRGPVFCQNHDQVQ